MWNGKLKAVTFSFDDGVTQDKRLIKLLNKYNLKATFNLNSSLLGLPGSLNINGKAISHDKVSPEGIKEIYCGHEIAVHTLTHPNLTQHDQPTIIHQVEMDRKALSDLFGYEVVGMAYPCGGPNNDDRVAEIIKNKTGVKYARTISTNGKFDLQENYFRFNPTAHVTANNLESIVEEFIALKTNTPKILYIWGHSYEFDIEEGAWEKLERILSRLSNKADIFYGMNKEVLLDK